MMQVDRAAVVRSGAPPLTARLSSSAGGIDQPQLVDATDASTVPYIPQVLALAQILDQSRPEDRQALSAGVAHAVIGDAVGAAAPQASPELLRRNVALGVVDRRQRRAPAADVVKPGGDVGQVAAHVQLDRLLSRRPQKLLAMKTGLGDRRGQTRCGIEHAV